MSVAAVYQKLCALNSTIAGVMTAPTAIPTVLNESELPCAITRPGAATSHEQAIGLYRSDREYVLDFYVSPVAHGEGIDEGFQAVIPILDAAVDLYVRNPSLDDTVDHIGDGISIYFDDSGHRILEYAGVPYHGFTITMKVTEKTT